jgi:hypothetical protein
MGGRPGVGAQVAPPNQRSCIHFCLDICCETRGVYHIHVQDGLPNADKQMHRSIAMVMP